MKTIIWWPSKLKCRSRFLFTFLNFFCLQVIDFQWILHVEKKTRSGAIGNNTLQLKNETVFAKKKNVVSPSLMDWHKKRLHAREREQVQYQHIIIPDVGECNSNELLNRQRIWYRFCWMHVRFHDSLIWNVCAEQHQTTKPTQAFKDENKKMEHMWLPKALHSNSMGINILE